MSEEFDRWWREIGSGISPLSQHDMEQHAERVASMAWERCEYRESMLRGEIDRLRADLAKRTEWRDRLAARVAELEAKADPLAEMWRELEAYQPTADRDGHGKSWARMCRERTEEAAEAAWNAAVTWLAAMAASKAALKAATAADAARFAADAVSAIRRAKEVQS